MKQYNINSYPGYCRISNGGKVSKLIRRPLRTRVLDESANAELERERGRSEREFTAAVENSNSGGVCVCTCTCGFSILDHGERRANYSTAAGEHL